MSPQVVVLAEAHVMVLCNRRKEEHRHDIRIASGGVGKKEKGDEKLPLGLYPLGMPRKSTKFGTFVPIGYPTPAQRKEGYTGDAVGIHGPHRKVKWLGGVNNWFDTTDGCVGVADDDTMADITKWIRKNKPKTILLREK
jgi:murein L,D-transpeptidase YafK